MCLRSNLPSIPREKHLPLYGSWGWKTPPPCHPRGLQSWMIKLSFFSLEVSDFLTTPKGSLTLSTSSPLL